MESNQQLPQMRAFVSTVTIGEEREARTLEDAVKLQSQQEQAWTHLQKQKSAMAELFGETFVSLEMDSKNLSVIIKEERDALCCTAEARVARRATLELFPRQPGCLNMESNQQLPQMRAFVSTVTIGEEREARTLEDALWQPLIKSTEVECVHSHKFLGLEVTSDPSWTRNTAAAVKRAQQRLYFDHRPLTQACKGLMESTGVSAVRKTPHSSLVDSGTFSHLPEDNTPLSSKETIYSTHKEEQGGPWGTPTTQLMLYSNPTTGSTLQADTQKSRQH
uniref:Uncharacterized protein n=1 Tax=Knipowitschia caucasica TaxID=637954 RepID=A0AAV2KQA5_KNICA